MAKKKRPPLPVIQISRKPLPVDAGLPAGFAYYTAPSVAELTMPPFDKAPLFNEAGVFDARHYQLGLFLLDETTEFLQQPDLLAQLPGNQLLIPLGFEASDPAVARILQLKGANQVSFADGEALGRNLAMNFFGGQTGYWMSEEEGYNFVPRYAGRVLKNGGHDVAYEIDAQDWTLYAYGADSYWIPHGLQDTVLLQYACDPGVHIMAKLKYFQPGTENLLKVETLVDDALIPGFEAVAATRGYNVQLVIYAKGKGLLHLGQYHFRKSRGGFGQLMINGKRLVDPDDLNSDILTYFDAGDMKPPMCIYFSGYQTAEQFEGFFMMRGMKSPFMLITDTRLQGGAFYMGSKALEDKVVAEIQHNLDLLGFTTDQLMLSGLSMGTFGALYYGARLAPNAIVVGKPLVNVGQIAENRRIFRPDQFATAFDMVRLYGGGADKAAIERTNQKFWTQFDAADFSHTTFAMAYMLNDDYDHHAFNEVRASLKKRFPLTRILSKGLIGRHNDDTEGIVKWFLMQYHHILEENFGRKFA